MRANAYVIDYDLELYSNFTYFLDDPVNGDQFAQRDDRTITGGEVAYTFGGDASSRNTIGAMLRNDDIGGVGLFHTAQRQPVNTIRSDQVDELSLGVLLLERDALERQVSHDVGRYAPITSTSTSTSELAANSGSADEWIVTPKASLIYSATDATEVYLSAGKGFHSNDARGTTITVDPVTGDPADKVSPLVDAHELEVGFRTFVDSKLNVSAALWVLELDSELLFIGDAGNTEASRPSRRYGLEVPLYYRPNDKLTFDVELALTHSEFSESAPEGDEIPGSIDKVLAAGITYQSPQGFFGSFRLRYFGPRPLIEDGSIESGSSTVANLEVGYRRGKYDFRIDVLNAFDSGDDDITYYYASRLPGEPEEGVEDFHFHPIEPRNLRASVSWKF